MLGAKLSSRPIGQASSARSQQPGLPAVASSIAPPDNGRPKQTALKYFVQTPIAMLLDPSLSNEAKVLASILIHYDGPRGCFPSTSRLAKDLNLSLDTVYRLIEELERYNFLSRKRVGRNNHYYLTPAYVPPVRTDSFEATGDLQIENQPRPRPARRRTLRKPRPALELPLSEPAVLESPTAIDAVREAKRYGTTIGNNAKRVAPVRPIAETTTVEVQELVAPVRPIDGANSLNSATQQVASVRPIESLPVVGHVAPVRPTIDSSEPREVASVRPVDVAPERPIAENTSHECDLDKNENQSLLEPQEQDHSQKSSSTSADDPLIVDEGEKERRGALVAFVRGTLLTLQRRVDPKYAESLAGSVAEKLVVAAIDELRDLDTASLRLLSAVQHERIKSHANPVGALLHGIVGVEGSRRYLLAVPSSPSRGNSARVGSLNDSRPPLERISPGLRDALLRRVRDNRAEQRWCAENGITPQMLDDAKAIVAKDYAAEPSRTPLCDQLELHDPVLYRSKLQMILDALPDHRVAPKRLESRLWLVQCKAMLERDLNG